MRETRTNKSKQLKEKFKLNNKGFGLVEVLLSLFVVSVGIMGSLLYFTTAKSATELARDMTTATTHAELILEEMSTKATLAEIETGDWDAYWSAFVTNNSINTLTDEAISVTSNYVYADLLNTTVGVSWTTGARAHSISLNTEFQR